MNFRDKFECPICMTWIKGEIIQCANGHIICITCYSNLQTLVCPSCKISCASLIRNRAMEQLRDEFEPCKHLGCSEIVLKTDTKHATECPHKPPMPPTWNKYPYEGGWLHGKPHGKGTGVHIQTTNICNHFKVVMEDWTHHPKNSILWKYTGNWIDGIPQGGGEAEAGEPLLRIFYKGDWENGYAHGFGNCLTSFENRETGHNYVEYNGGWQNGLFHGVGTHEVDGADGADKYYPQCDGLFENDTLVSGKMTCGERQIHRVMSDMISYQGQFSNPSGEFWSWCPHGTGTMAFANGDKYEGHFENGQPVNKPTLHPPLLVMRQQLTTSNKKVKELQAQLLQLRAGMKRKRANKQ